MFKKLYLKLHFPTVWTPISFWVSCHRCHLGDRPTACSPLTTRSKKMNIFDHKKVKRLAHTRLPSVGFRSWSRFLAVSLRVTWVINPAVGCHYFPPGLQLPTQPLRGLLPVLLLGKQMHDGCEQFAEDCYPTASRLRFVPGLFCAWVLHANHSAAEPPLH